MNELVKADEDYIRQYGKDHNILLSDDQVNEFCELVFDLAIPLGETAARDIALQQLKQRYEI